jgi:hypothetical protein
MLLEIMVLEDDTSLQRSSYEKRTKVDVKSMKTKDLNTSELEEEKRGAEKNKVLKEDAGLNEKRAKVSSSKKNLEEIAIRSGSSEDPRWSALLQRIKKKSFKLWAIFRGLETNVQDNKLVLKSRYKYNIEVLEDATNRELLENLVVELYGESFEAELELDTSKAQARTEGASDSAPGSNESIVEELF